MNDNAAERYLEMVKNTARFYDLKFRLDHNGRQEKVYELITEYISLLWWFEGLSNEDTLYLSSKIDGVRLN